MRSWGRKGVNVRFVDIVMRLMIVVWFVMISMSTSFPIILTRFRNVRREPWPSVLLLLLPLARTLPSGIDKLACPALPDPSLSRWIIPSIFPRPSGTHEITLQRSATRLACHLRCRSG